MTIEEIRNQAIERRLIVECKAPLKDETVDGAGYYECRSGHLHHVTYDSAMQAERSFEGFAPDFHRAWKQALYEEFHSFAVEMGERTREEVMLESLASSGYVFKPQDNII